MRRVIALSVLAAAVAGVAACGSDSGGGGTSSSGSANADKHVNIGSDEEAVVDPELRVRGVERLRVADASIMPFVTTGNTHAPALMIGARAAMMMLDSNRR